MRLKLVTLTSLLALFILSCQKGQTGPTGPAGPNGAQGPVGSANVIYSSWFTPAAYTKDTVFGIWGFNYNKPASDITQPVLDSGVVIVFAKLLGYNPAVWPATQVGQLPITLTYVQGVTMTDTWTAAATAGNLKIRFVNDHNFYTGISTSHQFRYIIVPGGVKSSAAEHPGIVHNYQSMTYAEVCKALGIAE